MPAAQGDFDRLLREKLATGPLVADFLSVPASPSPASALKDRSGSSTPSKNFEDAREARVRGFAQRTRAVRYKVVSVNRWEASGDDQDEDAGASGSGYHLYDALEEEEAIQLASKPKRPPPKPRPTSTQAKRMAAEAEAEQARIASLLPMLKEYLKVSSDLTQEELDRLGTRAPPPPELDESLPSNATEPADDYVYDLYLVANHESDLSNKPDGFAGESLSADEWRERLLSRPGATAGELVWLEDDDLVMDDDGNESMDSEDSNGGFHPSLVRYLG